MSRVTDVILSFSVLEDQEKKCISEVNNAIHLKLVSRAPQMFPLPEPEIPAGGYKAWQSDVRFCAFNNSPTSVILECIDAALWKHRDDIEVLVREEDAQGWAIYKLDDLEDVETLEEIRGY